MMKGKGARFVKQIISMVINSVRSKTDAVKGQFMVTALTVLSKKNKLSTKINDAIDGILTAKEDNDEQLSSKAVVLFNNNKAAVTRGKTGNIHFYDDNDDDEYPDLRHTLFDEEEEEELAQLLDDPNSSISAIDIVKNSKENIGEGFVLEKEIDEVADLFISKFHKSMRIQKLLSFKRQQQMLDDKSA